MPRKLKVYRTPIGFHDAFVAAPNQKAALKAWGADANLFARGIAEEVTDPELMKAALAELGKIVRKARGTADEHLAALPPNRPPKTTRPKAAGQSAKAASKHARKPKPKPRPRPSRRNLDQAEAATANAEADHVAAMRAIDTEQAELARRRRELTAAHDLELKRLRRDQQIAEEQYRAAMKTRRGD